MISRPAAGSRVTDDTSTRVLLGAAALLSGMAAGWLSAGSFGMLAAMAVLLAVGTGYGKAYSP